MINQQHLAKDLEQQTMKQEGKLALQQGQGEDWGLTQHCIASEGEDCWSATGLTKSKLKMMCGMSDGDDYEDGEDGYEIRNGGCIAQGYTCDIKGGFNIATVGMGFYRRPHNGKCPSP
eukprot:TRINITY_DN1504_c0_g1_i13.p1 TRINITY_DN1504_c0_g1~~TRINITY_DN1504_c0_g1_i13.p1  ORF type:complete len:118 (+),score=32.96 TRINITY_DN1504_c0_g1_i13:225-578(+)